MPEFFTYSPDRVVISFNGIDIRGFAPDTFVEIERDEDTFIKYKGALNDTARTQNLNTAGKVTVTLMAVSSTNDLLSASMTADELFGLNYGELLVKDLSGNMLCMSTNAWVLKWPKIDRGKESGSIVWVFDCADLEIIAGGNLI